MSTRSSNYPVWDIPTRLFHWLLVLGLFLGWLSHEQDWIDVHRWTGYGLLVLVLFRMIWGFIGSVHARFSDFVRPPWQIIRYWRGEPAGTPGHNPAGAWSVLVLLLLVLAQATTGLFNSDGLFFDGPLHHLVPGAVADKLGALHETIFWWIVGFAGLHIAAIAWYQFGRGERLVQRMVVGGDDGRRAPVSNIRAVVVLATCAAALALGLYLVPEPTLPW